MREEKKGTVRDEKLMREGLQQLICSTYRPLQVVRRNNEDGNTYTTLGSRGPIFLHIPHVALNKKQTLANKGGMTDICLSQGTYVKSFYTVMMMPSSVKVGLMGNSSETKRLHHVINWNNTVPKIISQELKKK